MSLSPALAAASAVNFDERGIAIHGYDPVSYHISGTPRQGDRSLRAEYGGGTFLFSSRENRDAFLATPERFVPAYGGFCSYGVRVGKKFDGDPQVWKMVDGRVFLQLDRGTQRVWLKDMHKNIAIAERLWPTVRERRPD